MRSKTIFGALLVSVALCSQGFGLELLDRVLGRDNGGCGECNACAKVAPCEKACEKACVKPCLPAVCEQPNCCPKKCRATPVRDLFDNLKDMFEAKACMQAQACEAPKCCPEPCAKAACAPTCKKVKGCEKACRVPACEKVCKPKCHKLYRRPVLELLENLFGCDECDNCGSCEAACGGAPAAAPKTPAKGTEAAPVPAPKAADPSASIQGRGIYQASRTLVRN